MTVFIAVVILLVAPWINPISYGPTPTVIQWVMTCTGGATCWLLVSIANVDGTFIRKVIAVAWTVAAVVSAAMGLVQYLGAVDILGSFVSSAESGQAYANLRQRNHLGTLLNMGLAAVIALTYGTKRNLAQGRWVVIVIMALLATANTATGSRTGFLQFMVLIAMSLCWRKEPRMLLSTVIAYVVAVWMLPVFSGANPFASGILGRVVENNLDCISRLTLWSNVLHLIAQKPWLGWGWGELDYAHFITPYPGERFCEILDNAHNLPLHLAVELGIPAAAVICGGCAWLVWRNKPWAETDATRQLAWAVLAVIGLHSMLEYPLWYGPFQLAVVLCIWLLWRDSAADAEPAQRSPLARATGAAAVTLLALCIYVAWDYWRISQIYLAPVLRNAAYRDDTLAKVQGSRLFRDQVQFAELTLTPLDEDNAVHIHALAKAMLHFSPEPRVVEKVIESAVMLHQDDEALFYLQRYKVAFPTQHARWSAALKTPE